MLVLTVVASPAGGSGRALAGEAAEAVALAEAVVEAGVGAAGVADLAQVALEAVAARAADGLAVRQARAAVRARVRRAQVSCKCETKNDFFFFLSFFGKKNFELFLC